MTNNKQCSCEKKPCWKHDFFCPDNTNVASLDQEENLSASESRMERSDEVSRENAEAIN